MIVFYIVNSGVPAGGTNKGHIAIWKNNLFKPDDPWDLQSPCEVEGSVQSIEVSYAWGCFITCFQFEVVLEVVPCT